MENLATSLNWIDYTIIGIIVLSTLISLIRGFVREALSLITWVVAFWVAFKFASSVSPLFVKYIGSETIRFTLAFALLMVGALIAGAVINYFIVLLVNKTGLSGTDRLLGILFGVARGALLVAVLLLIGQLSGFQTQPVWGQSHLAPQFAGLVDWMRGFLPEQIPHLSKVIEKTSEEAENKATEKEWGVNQLQSSLGVIKTPWSIGYH